MDAKRRRKRMAVILGCGALLAALIVARDALLDLRARWANFAVLGRDHRTIALAQDVEAASLESRAVNLNSSGKPVEARGLEGKAEFLCREAGFHRELARAYLERW